MTIFRVYHQVLQHCWYISVLTFFKKGKINYQTALTFLVGVGREKTLENCCLVKSLGSLLFNNYWQKSPKKKKTERKTWILLNNTYIFHKCYLTSLISLTSTKLILLSVCNNFIACNVVKNSLIILCSIFFAREHSFGFIVTRMKFSETKVFAQMDTEN